MLELKTILQNFKIVVDVMSDYLQMKKKMMLVVSAYNMITSKSFS